MARFFDTIGHTFALMGMSWQVFKKDRELILFPLTGAVVMAALIGGFAAVALATGTFDRVDALENKLAGASLTAGDVVLGIVLAFLITLVGIFFNSALIAAALERLRGGDPNFRSGIREAVRHIDATRKRQERKANLEELANATVHIRL